MSKINSFSLFLVMICMALSTPATAKDDNAGACIAAIAGTFFAGCKMGAEVQGKSCYGALDEMESSCSALGDCRYGCRQDKKAARAEVKSNYKACKESCKSAQKKTACRKACRSTKRSAMKALRMTKKQCKKSCKNDFNDADCKKARAKFVAWASATGVGAAAITKYCSPR